ncbi:hypothetical protein MESS2_1150006 [Mesorhizobium metallidurans STM 2683]|uniref:Uncharacterized protein n=1 Tax=Mesorhizobium metallidurans STM 2683 TaxID=1297569 RepID=M5EHP6_9HYPH|nr:hypothetical protein MESS2_1150006 [Mesorhizobium metallidurans STM 2683]
MAARWSLSKALAAAPPSRSPFPTSRSGSTRPAAACAARLEGSYSLTGEHNGLPSAIARNKEPANARTAKLLPDRLLFGNSVAREHSTFAAGRQDRIAGYAKHGLLRARSSAG